MSDLTVQNENTVVSSVKSILNNESMKKRFENILGQKAPGYMASILNVINGSMELQKVEPNSIIMSALVAATLDMPIDKNLGFAHIVPYSGKAQFQMGYKGFIQLAMRTGQYKTINATEIYDGELVKYSRLKGEVEIDESKRKSNKIIGYAAFFSLVNGFEKTLYMPIEELRQHGKKYSKSYNFSSGIWKQNEHAMCIKTVLKLLLSKYGILSIEMQTAIKTDQAVINSDNLSEENAVSYIDNPNYKEIVVDTSTGEVVNEEVPADPGEDIASTEKDNCEIDFSELPDCLK